jgi:hypothetical protein
MILGGIKQVMRDFGEYLRAYWDYVSTSVGLGKALAVALMWVAGIFIPLGAKTFFAVAKLVDADVDGRLGIAQLYLRAVRDVEAPSRSDRRRSSRRR